MAKTPLCFLDFDTGRVVIELDAEDCPKASEFFLKVAQRDKVHPAYVRHVDGKCEDVKLDYVYRCNEFHVFKCNHLFFMNSSGDKRKEKDARSEWGLRWDKGHEFTTYLWLSRSTTKDTYFGRVIEGAGALEQRPGTKLVLKGSGIVE